MTSDTMNRAPNQANGVGAQGGPLQAGAAKVDVTPPADALPTGYKAIHDAIYARVIVIDNGQTKAVLVSLDLGMTGDDFYAALVQEIGEAVGCPVDHVLISCTHTHGAPAPNLTPVPGMKSSGFMSFDPAYAARIKDGTLTAVQQARSALQPARMGYGTGAAHLNVNRDAIHPETRTWYQGPNLDGPSDKTVAVVKFESLGGELIAVYINYAMHANLMFMRNELGGDFAGAVSRYIEGLYDDKVVALWTSGAAGDQNPLHWRLGEPTIAAVKRPHFLAAGGAADDVIGLANFLDVEIDPKTLELGTRLIDSIGLLLGEEVVRILGTIKRTTANGRIWGKLESIRCPGRRRLDKGREGAAGEYADGDPVTIRLGLLVVDQIAFAAVTGEPYTNIGLRLKAEAPYGHTIMVTLANGRSAGYIPDDSAYGRHTFQVLSTRIKPGCAEQAIVGTFLALMAESLQEAQPVT